jgi:hypothetical protein
MYGIEYALGEAFKWVSIIVIIVALIHVLTK